MKAAIHTLGCKVNIYESEYITNILKENGYQIVDFDSKADIYIINTCTVTNTSDKKSEKMIKRARKQNKDAIIIAMGCHAQIKGDNIDADIIIGNKDKSKIISLIEEYQENKNKIKRIYNLDNVSFEDMYISSFNSHTRAFVKIQDGCDAFCSYCIIPYARGPIRSKDPKTVIKEITSLVENGYKEIILTGIHTGKYGKDINYTFEQLLKDIIKIKNLYRIRISSIEINELTDPILNLIKDNQVIAKHLHIPLQSGSDKILKLMDRKYDLKFYKDRIEKIRKMIKDVSITTDLIVGFPNENEKDMEDTLKFLKEIKFTKIHTFPYSKREGTKAASMENQIDETIKRKRVKTVLELSDQLEQDFYQSKLNETEEVIIEQTKDGKSYGYTSNYIKVEINSPLKPNEDYAVKMYAKAVKILKKYGFNRYEVSNFAKSGYECKHNVNCWNRHEYLGLGAGANGFVNGFRYGNVCDINAYIKSVKNGKTKEEFREKISNIDAFEETLMLGLRMEKGVEIRILNELIKKDFIRSRKGKLDELSSLELIKYNEERLRVTDKGFYVLNEIILDLI